jgi:type II secretory pathway component PulM
VSAPARSRLVRVAGRAALFVAVYAVAFAVWALAVMDPLDRATDRLRREAAEVRQDAREAEAAARRPADLAAELAEMEEQDALLAGLLPGEIEDGAAEAAVRGLATGAGVEIRRLDREPVQDREFYREARLILDLDPLDRDRLVRLVEAIHRARPLLRVVEARIALTGDTGLLHARLVVGSYALSEP